jgi:glycosyltransferase involved in cell wall biosynthesis
MKIFSFIRQYSFAKYIMADILSAFRDLGCRVKWIDLEHVIREKKGQTQVEKEYLPEEIRSDVAAFDPDVVFTYGLEYLSMVFKDLDPAFNQNLYELIGRPAVHFFFDFGSPFDKTHPTEEDAAFLKVSQSPDFLFLCWDQDALARMKAFGLTKAFFFPMAVNPNAFFKIKELSGALQARRTNIVFAGGPTPERIAHLNAIADLGLSIYGYGEEEWKANPKLVHCWHAPILEREQLNEHYNAAKISVNITRPHGSSSLNMRVYEAMASGSLMLTDEKSDAGKLFEPGREIVVYNGLEDLRQKAVYYLDHERERREIAEAGRMRVLEEHTYSIRAQQFMPTIIQFLKENDLFRKIFEQNGQDPKRTFSLLLQKPIADVIQLNMDHYSFVLGCYASKLGEPELAKAYVRTSLEINPAHHEAKQFQQCLRQ